MSHDTTANIVVHATGNVNLFVMFIMCLYSVQEYFTGRPSQEQVDPLIHCHTGTFSLVNKEVTHR